MKIGTILHDGALLPALFEGDGVALLPAASVLDLIVAPDRLAELARTARPTLVLSEVELAPPIPRPGKFLCLALNNSANKDRILRGPDHPAFFPKPASSLIGGGQPIELRPYYGRVHPEPELALVIGKGGRDIAAGEAYGHVFGYTILNDLTSPTMREDDSFHYRAIHPDGNGGVRHVETWVSYPGRYKGTDGFGPIGPWIVTKDEIPDPHDLTVRCLHQGRVVTEDNTANLFYKVPEILAYISRYMTLEAGDIISLGTALKNAASGGRAVQTVDLNQQGGPIEVSISGIGTLSNPVARHDL